MNVFRKLRRAVGERGQVLMITAGILPILLGMAGLAVDYGSYASERRDLQNAADSIALAAAQELPDQGDAESVADDWAARNGIDLDDVTVTVSGGSVEPQVRVVISRPHSFTFMRVLGIDERNVGARAAAGKFSFGAAAGVVPWSITQNTVDNSPPGTIVTMKYDSNGGSNGNFGAIRIDGNGASDYEYSAKYGSSNRVCAQTTPGCTAAECPGSTCAETAPECDGDQCQPKTGNMTGPTRDAVDFRMNNTSASCDTFAEVFTPVTAYTDINGDLLVVSGGSLSGRGGQIEPLAKKTDTPTNTPTNTPTRTNTPGPTNTATKTNTPGPTNTPAPTNTPGGPTNTPVATATSTGGGADQYALNPNCNPWRGPGACPAAPSAAPCSRRVIIIPVIDGFGNGSSDDVTILRFALIFLEGYEGGKCSGNSCEIKGRFVNAELTTGALAGAYDPDASVKFTKLIE